MANLGDGGHVGPEPIVAISGGDTLSPPADGNSAEGGPIDDVNDVTEQRDITFTLYPPKELLAFVTKDEDEFSADLVKKEEYASMLEQQILRMRMVRGRHLRQRIAAKEEESKKQADEAEHLRQEQETRLATAKKHAEEAAALREKLAKYGG